MNKMNSQSKKDHSNRLNKKRLNQDEVRLLEASFNYNKKLEPDQKLQLARQLGVPPRQIAIWYQNKRARWKNQSLELDYGALQLSLETALADKMQLEKQVQQLQVQLHSAQQTLLLAQDHQHFPPISSNFSDNNNNCCCDDQGVITSSSSWENGDHQLEDLYACLMGGGQEALLACRSNIEQNDQFSLYKV